jgi:hypothetical protein
MLDWIVKNKEWIFSGVGVAVLGVTAQILKLRKRSTDDRPVQKLSIAQAPTITQAPVLNITNQVTSPAASKPIPVASPKPQAPIFGLNPIVVVRDIQFIDPELSDDGTAKVCIARFRLRGDQQGSMQDRFEASLDYIEHLSASGMPYEHRAGHINRAQWLPQKNGDHELLLVVERNYLLYAVNAVEQSSYRDRLAELDLKSTRPFVTVTLTELTNGQKWQTKFQVTYDLDLHTLAVREISSLRPIG